MSARRQRPAEKHRDGHLQNSVGIDCGARSHRSCHRPEESVDEVPDIVEARNLLRQNLASGERAEHDERSVRGQELKRRREVDMRAVQPREKRQDEQRKVSVHPGRKRQA